MLFLFDTGCRVSELCGLKYRDLTLHSSHGQAKVLGKGRKERTVPFSRRACRALRLYLNERPREPHEPVFLAERGIGEGVGLTRSGVQQLFGRLGKAAGLRGVRCSPHTARHSFAILFLRNGGHLFTLQSILGHTNLKMTQRYVAIAQADMENQHRQFSPADSLR